MKAAEKKQYLLSTDCICEWRICETRLNIVNKDLQRNVENGRASSVLAHSTYDNYHHWRTKSSLLN